MCEETPSKGAWRNFVDGCVSHVMIRNKQINGCVKKLLERVHGGILWMDRPMPIIVYFITTITEIPMDEENLEKYLEDKTKEKSISDEIKAKYGIERGNRGIKISDINDLAMIFATRILG
jgi:hypothetical protein